MWDWCNICLLYTSPSPRDRTRSRMPSSAWKKKKIQYEKMIKDVGASEYSKILNKLNQQHLAVPTHTQYTQ